MSDAITAPPTEKGGIFYGWIIVLAAFFAFFLVYGTVTYSFAVFVNPIAEEFGTSVTNVTLAFTAMNIGTGLLSPFAGRLMAKFQPRKCMVGGLAVLAIGYFLLSLTTATWQVIALFAVVISLGGAIVAPLGASSIVTNWFTAQRGRALTIAILGTSGGQIIFAKYIASPIIRDHSWETAFQVFAACYVVAIPLIWFLVVDHPEEKGLKPFGSDTVTAAAGASDSLNAPKMTTGEVLRRGDFWSIGVGYLFVVTSYLSAVGTIVAYGRTFGMPATEAANLVLTMGIAGVIGKLGFATWTDRMGLRNTLWIAAVLNFIALGLQVAIPTVPVLYVAAAFYGASAGGILPVWPGLIAFRFGRAALPQVMGIMSPMVWMIQGFGAPFTTAMDFKPAFYFFMVLLVLSLFITRNLNKVK